MKAVVFGSSAREASISTALQENNYDVFSIATDTENHPINVPYVHHLGSLATSGVRPVELVSLAKPDLIVIQEEQLLFAGLSTVLRAEGFAVLGADQGPSMIEFEKASTRAAIGKEFPGHIPNQLPTIELEKMSDQIEAKYVVRTKSVLDAQTTVIVRDGESRQRAIELANKYEVTVEEFIVGIGVTYYVFTDGEKVTLSTPIKTYPFRHDGESGVKTGGMGVASLADISNERLLDASKFAKEIAEFLVRNNQHIGRLQSFSVELVIDDDNITYIESDSRLGDPENCLLNEMIGRKEFGELLIAVANDELVDISTKHTVGLGIVLAPRDYPRVRSPQIISSSWVERLSESGELYLGKVKYLDNGNLRLGSSRSGVYVRVGTKLGSVANAAYGNLLQASIPEQLDYRSDIAK